MKVSGQKNNFKKISIIFFPIITLVLGLILEDIYEIIKEKISINPYIAVVMSQKAVDFTVPSEFVEGFSMEMKGKTFIDSKKRTVDIKIIEDLGSPKEAERIAHKLISDKNCVLVVGNSNSTLTDITMDIFLRSNDPLPYILPIATDNDILTKAKNDGHKAVLRMVPENKKQGTAIVELAEKIAPNLRVAIYGDQEIRTYSLNLGRDISSQIREEGGKIIIEELLGPTNSLYNTASILKSNLKPELIVYLGVAHHGLLLIDQLSEMKINIPIIFSDGCMVQSLLDNTNKLPEPSFIISPVEIPDDKEMPTFKPIGRDAYTLVSQIISSCEKCTRKEIREYIANPKTKIHIKNGFAGEYEFDSDGNNKAMEYKVYKIINGKLHLLTDY